MTTHLISLILLLLVIASLWFARAADAHDSTVAGRLNRALSNTPMRGLGLTLEHAGHTYGVSPAFLAAVAGAESSYGAAMCLPYNAWGLGSCGRAWTPPTFRSWAHSIMYFARWFRSRWPSSTSPWAVGSTYCPPCGSRWGDRVAELMRRMGFAPNISYRRDVR